MALCELCGRDDFVQAVIIEKVSLQACLQCSRYGAVVKTKQLPFTTAISRPQPAELKVTNAVSEMIRAKREEMGLTISDFALYLNERESLVSKWLSGKLKPGINEAVKLEKKLQLTLLETENNIIIDKEPSPNDSELTLGDIPLKTRKKGIR